jgi:hypothetical protein
MLFSIFATTFPVPLKTSLNGILHAFAAIFQWQHIPAAAEWVGNILPLDSLWYISINNKHV